MYLSIKSRIVSHRAAKVGRDRRGDRCCRKTYNRHEVRAGIMTGLTLSAFYSCTLDSRVQALIRVSSIPPTSAGLMLSRSFVSSGNSTCPQKHLNSQISTFMSTSELHKHHMTTI